MRLVPVSFAAACEFVGEWHRHNRPPVGHKFSVGVAVGDCLVGVAMVSRPVARHLDDGLTLEVARVATDGTPNACSKLYAAAWQASKGMGYARLVTYTQAPEPGTSLRAAGWRVVAQLRERQGWSVPSRPRHATYRSAQRTLWEAG